MATMKPRRSSKVRQATVADMDVVYAWLTDQEKQGGHDSLLCNWSLTMNEFRRVGALVYDDATRGGVIAYWWGGLAPSAILEVRADRRGMGVGRAMAEHCLAEALEAGESLFLFECAPSSSVSFWGRMGFTAFDDGRHDYATLMVPVRCNVPPGLKSVTVAVEVFPDDRRYDCDVPALERFNCIAFMEPEAELVYLPHRIQWFEGRARRDHRNTLVVRVGVDGREWFFDKTSREAAEDLGLHQNAAGCWLDVLEPPTVGSLLSLPLLLPGTMPE